MPDVVAPVCVKLVNTNEIIVRADDPGKIIRLEGNWYFHPSLIDAERFMVSDRLYTCPYKGTCNWVDYRRDKTYLPDVAWVYPKTLPGFRNLAGWYGFYPDTIYYKTGDC